MSCRNGANICGTRLQAVTNPLAVLASGNINELGQSEDWESLAEYNLTVLFPAPLGPITLVNGTFK
jgi:hypothetical protein